MIREIAMGKSRIVKNGRGEGESARVIILMAEQGNPGGGGGDPSGPYTQNFKHNPVSARVPDAVAHGTFSTGALVQTLPSEFIIDFLQGLTRPAQVAARVVVSPLTMQQMLAA